MVSVPGACEPWYKPEKTRNGRGSRIEVHVGECDVRKWRWIGSSVDGKRAVFKTGQFGGCMWRLWLKGEFKML